MTVSWELKIELVLVYELFGFGKYEIYVIFFVAIYIKYDYSFWIPIMNQL